MLFTHCGLLLTLLPMELLSQLPNKLLPMLNSTQQKIEHDDSAQLNQHFQINDENQKHQFVQQACVSFSETFYIQGLKDRQKLILFHEQ